MIPLQSKLPLLITETFRSNRNFISMSLNIGLEPEVWHRTTVYQVEMRRNSTAGLTVIQPVCSDVSFGKVENKLWKGHLSSLEFRWIFEATDWKWDLLYPINHFHKLSWQYSKSYLQFLCFLFHFWKRWNNSALKEIVQERSSNRKMGTIHFRPSTFLSFLIKSFYIMCDNLTTKSRR